jgi:predicted TIM-barrel fold metal-dependent hydrolase
MPGTEDAPVVSRVDAHCHLWDLALRPQPWTAGEPSLARSFSFEDLRGHLDRHRIDVSVVVQTVPVSAETRELLALAATEARIAGVVGWVDLAAPGVTDALSALRDGAGGDRLVGVRHLVQDEPDPTWLTRPTVRRGLEAVGAAGLVFDLLVRPAQLDAAVAAVEAMPGTAFVLDHAGKLMLGEADAVVLSACVQMPSLPVVAEVERLLGLPVVTAATATAREIIELLDEEPEVDGAGAALARAYPGSPGA